jgi:hypothetical protein
LFWGFQFRPGLRDVERSQGTQDSSAESLHRPTAYFSQKVFPLSPFYFPLTLASSSLPEFERRSQGSIRGDAKKFALERAQDFIVRFGLSDEFHGVEEPESRFKEVRIFACIVTRLFIIDACHLANLQLVQEYCWTEPSETRRSPPICKKSSRERYVRNFGFKSQGVFLIFFPPRSCGCSCK